VKRDNGRALGHANNYKMNIESMHKDYCSDANDWAVLCPDRRGD